MATPVVTPPGSLLDEKLKKSSPGKFGGIIFGIMLVAGLIYIGIKLDNDLSIVHSASVFPFILLGIALLIALGFEFVNGFTTRPTPSRHASTPTHLNRTLPWSTPA